VYYAADIIPNEKAYNDLLPNYPEITDRKINKNYGIIKKGDDLRVRVE
jgi:hypothetical protein